MKRIAVIVIAAVMACSTVRADAPVQVRAENGGVQVGVRFFANPIEWVRQNPWRALRRALGTAAVGYGAYRVADHNDWFSSSSGSNNTYHDDSTRYDSPDITIMDSSDVTIIIQQRAE